MFITFDQGLLFLILLYVGSNYHTRFITFINRGVLARELFSPAIHNIQYFDFKENSEEP